MVSPLMRESKTPYPQDPSEPTADHVASTIVDLLARLHVLVIGPGLGRDELMQATCKKVITAARERQIPTVMDADALMIVNAEPSFVKGWKEVILTPNVVEFQRLAAAVGVDVGGVPREEACKHVSQALGGVCIIQKGDVDYISDGERTMTCDLQGGKKRSGGQGDTLTGSVGTFLCWRRAYLDKLWETEGNMGEDELVMLSAWGGAAITRECSRLAFAEKGRSLQASDVGDNVPRAFEALIGEREVGGEGARL
ncbi:MAG: hypothetical protein LQ340_004863 [Diploschistes diacapsis]|nr:MAG: hypothetical protein LQ340_004863 [Diploschistes diacapsis]